MNQIQIHNPCPYCKGQAYLPFGQSEDAMGNPYSRHLPCPLCQGSGMSPKMISIQDLLALLNQAQCAHLHTSFRGGMHCSMGDVWDDIHEVCDDCGASLDKPILGDYIHDIP